MHDGGVAVAALDLDRQVDRAVGVGDAADRQHRHHLLGPEQGMVLVDLDDREPRSSRAR